MRLKIILFMGIFFMMQVCSAKQITSIVDSKVLAIPIKETNESLMI